LSQKSKGSSEGIGGLLARGEQPWIDISAQMHDHSMTLAQVPAKEFYYDAEVLVETTADVAAYYNMDDLNPFADIYNFEIEALGGNMIYGEKSMPTIDFRDPLIKRPEDLDKLKKKEVDFYNDGRLHYALETIEQSLKYGVIQGMFCSPFSMAVGLRSYPKLIRDMRRNPEFAHKLFKFIVDDVLTPYIKAQNRYSGVIMAIGADAWACIPNLSVEEMKEWVVPYNQRLMDNTKKFGVLSMNISGDYCEERPEKFDKEILHGSFDVEMASQGAPALFLGMGRWQDYPLDAVRDYTKRFRDNGETVTIMASINARLLRDGPPEKIIDLVKRHIDTFGRDHNLSIFCANIPADAPPEHIHAAIQATHTYGRFPIAENLDEVDFELKKRESFQEWKKKV
jgi:uroporphyrinogen decarboxylase